MIAYGRRVVREDLLAKLFLDGEVVRTFMNHRFISTFPKRWVYKWDTRGAACERCDRDYRIWICDDRVWRKLPRRWWKSRLCTRCFRKLVTEKAEKLNKRIP